MKVGAFPFNQQLAFFLVDMPPSFCIPELCSFPKAVFLFSFKFNHPQSYRLPRRINPKILVLGQHSKTDKTLSEGMFDRTSYLKCLCITLNVKRLRCSSKPLVRNWKGDFCHYYFISGLLFPMVAMGLFHQHLI